MKLASVKVDDKLLAEYREASKQTGISISRLIEDAMRFFPVKKLIEDLRVAKEEKFR